MQSLDNHQSKFLFSPHGTIIYGVRDYVGPYSLTAEQSTLSVDALTNAFNIEDPVILRSIIQATMFRTDTAYIDAEIADLPSRIGGKNDLVIEPVSVNSYINLKPLMHYVEYSLPVNTSVTRHVRYLNNGGWISSNHETPVFISYRWYKSASVIVSEGLRSSLITPIAPGREFSLPIDIHTPAEAGHYTLEILPVHEYVQWYDDQKLTISVFVTHQPSAEVTKINHTSIDTYTYHGDHAVGVNRVKAWINQQSPGKRLKILEVAAGCNPCLLELAKTCDLLVNDVCLNQLIIVLAIAQQKGIEIEVSTFDLACPPLIKNQFDCIAMFSALHHMPDPVMCLLTLKELLSQNGVICCMCEPCGANRNSHAFVKDFSLGINEQWFEMEEYLSIFERAGLEIVQGFNDGGSLKVILQRK